MTIKFNNPKIRLKNKPGVGPPFSQGRKDSVAHQSRGRGGARGDSCTHLRAPRPRSTAGGSRRHAVTVAGPAVTVNVTANSRTVIVTGHAVPPYGQATGARRGARGRSGARGADFARGRRPAPTRAPAHPVTQRKRAPQPRV